MNFANRARKLFSLIKQPLFLRALVSYRIAAATEHLEAIKLTDASTLIDIGANKGQFSLAFRAMQARSRIIAFDPLPEAVEKYEKLFAGDADVVIHRCALADAEGEATFHVTDRADSSSLLKPGRGQSQAFGVSAKHEIKVLVHRLDSKIDLASLARPILIKIDVQGAELLVLQGCDNLELADFIYVELSFVELYQGQAMFEDVALALFSRGFSIRGVFNQAVTQSFGPTQADVLFARQPARPDER